MGRGSGLGDGQTAGPCAPVEVIRVEMTLREREKRFLFSNLLSPEAPPFPLPSRPELVGA
jgi:hypothetical protein